MPPGAHQALARGTEGWNTAPSWARCPNAAPALGGSWAWGPMGRQPQARPSVTLRLHSVPGQPPLARCSTHMIKANSPAAIAACRHETDPASAPARLPPALGTASSHSTEPRRLPAPPSCDRCHINISRVLPMQDSPSTAWPPCALCQTNPTDSFLQASLWPLPHRRMGLGRAQGEGVLRCLTSVPPAQPHWEGDSTGKAEAGQLLMACRGGDGTARRSPAGSSTSPGRQGGWKMMGRF